MIVGTTRPAALVTSLSYLLIGFPPVFNKFIHFHSKIYSIEGPFDYRRIYHFIAKCHNAKAFLFSFMVSKDDFMAFSISSDVERKAS